VKIKGLIPAGEINFVSSEVKIKIREGRADFQEECTHELIGIVETGIHWSKGARGLSPRVARSQ
jgi:hypothetical protein